MPFPAAWQARLRKLGWVERTLAVLAVVYAICLGFARTATLTSIVQLPLFVFATWAAVRLLRRITTHVIWRLRNRLLVTYVFIGGVPILLLVVLFGLSIYGLASQVAVYLVTSELDRRVESIRTAAATIVDANPRERADTIRRIGEFFAAGKMDGMTILLRTPSGVERYPAGSKLNPPAPKTPERSGIVEKDGAYFAWAHLPFDGGDITLLAPMGLDQLSQLVPNLGTAELLPMRPSNKKGSVRLRIEDQDLEVGRATATSAKLPPPAFRFDSEVAFPALTPITNYDDPSKTDNTLLYVTSRLSAVYNVLFSRKSDYLQVIYPILLAVVSGAFLIVELISLVVGVGMTRTITNAVHHLYDGTQRVMQGDFSHRIQVIGSDQLADLSLSFNLMTERIQNLLAVAKEKERLQSEIEIAREVQSQLYPKSVPAVRSLKLTAVCKPARMVSGDYFDYDCIHGDKIAIAVGDVAGKGISAALLMATLQSSLRTELRHSGEIAVDGANGNGLKALSTSCLVSHLNVQLHANTSPEKYATFYLAIYDESSSTLRYTNAGHLPPILVRNGEASRLNVDGTVVGAFPFAQYDESSLEMRPGDLLVIFTDGVSEPENEFGEMFGEDRLVDLIVRNVHKSDNQIIETVIGAVEQWTGSPELQDDMTLLLARRE